MRDKLIIYLNANDLPNSRWVTGSYAHQGETESLIDAAVDREVILLVPAEDVVLVTAKVPKMSRARLLQALPYALEEQMIADVDDLHFAADNYLGDGSLPVAVTSHKKMQSWLTLLKSWNISADIIIPSTFALPVEDTSWHVLLSDMAIVRIGMFQGFACDINNFTAMLQLAIATVQPSPKVIYVHNYTNHSYSHTINFPADIKEEFLTPSQMMTDLMKNVTNGSTLNLLQGKYAVKKPTFPVLKLGWKVAAYLALACITFFFLCPSISYVILKQRANSLQDQIAKIYQYNFPQAKSVVAPKLRMQEKLQNLSGKIGENQSLLLIGFVGKGILETPSIKLKRFDFQNGQLTIELTAPTSEEFSTFTEYLMRQGLNVKQQNANLVSGRINATLQIE